MKPETRCEFMYGRQTRPDVIPIPLRADVTAFVHIPLDLTKQEAEKVARVVLAYAKEAAA